MFTCIKDLEYTYGKGGGSSINGAFTGINGGTHHESVIKLLFIQVSRVDIELEIIIYVRREDCPATSSYWLA